MPEKIELFERLWKSCSGPEWSIYMFNLWREFPAEIKNKLARQLWGQKFPVFKD